MSQNSPSPNVGPPNGPGPTPPYGGPSGGFPAPGTTPPSSFPTSAAPQHGGLPPTPSRSKGLAITSLVCGLVSLVFAWVPVVNVLALLAGLVAIALGVVSLVKKADGKVMAWFGAGLGLLGLLGSLLMMVLFAALISKSPPRPTVGPVPDPLKDRNVAVKVQYRVTTTGPASLRYTSPTGSSDLVVSKAVTEEFTAKAGDYLRLSIGAARGADADLKVSCEILVDGASVAKETGEGRSADSSCTYARSFSRSSSEAPAKDVAVEFKVTANGKGTAISSWSASGGSSRSTRTTDITKDATTTVRAKADGNLNLTVRGSDFDAKNPNFACEILVDGKSVAKQQSNTAFGSARCDYVPER